MQVPVAAYDLHGEIKVHTRTVPVNSALYVPGSFMQNHPDMMARRHVGGDQPGAGLARGVLYVMTRCLPRRLALCISLEGHCGERFGGEHGIGTEAGLSHCWRAQKKVIRKAVNNYLPVTPSIDNGSDDGQEYPT
ncbi:hypothetical protein N658DRAFT_56331 [Parathielavia hyrcaniae]|uniref:Uncharacterized protein n=1 Tax=Parathielavia hyrcaniae TaxID=113614 RepID=A0AAN6SW62_9PEZI|nr:hypothetical protein N658DRAFT_56331 [Parathielavia hyrcaniae]